MAPIALFQHCVYHTTTLTILMKLWIVILTLIFSLAGCTGLETTEPDPAPQNETEASLAEKETENTTESTVKWLQYDTDFSNMRVLYPEGWGIVERDNLLTMTSTENSSFSINMLFDPEGNPENYYADSYITNVLDPKYALTQNNTEYRKEMIGQRDAIIIPDYGSDTTAVDMVFVIDGTTVYSITYPSANRFEDLHQYASDIVSQLTFVDTGLLVNTENLANFDSEYFSFLYPKDWIIVEQTEENVLLKLYILERESATNAETSTVFSVTIRPGKTMSEVEELVLARLTETETEDMRVSNKDGRYIAGNSWGRETNVLLPGKSNTVLEVTIVSNIAQSKETVSQILRTFYVQ